MLFGGPQLLLLLLNYSITSANGAERRGKQVTTSVRLALYQHKGLLCARHELLGSLVGPFVL